MIRDRIYRARKPERSGAKDNFVDGPLRLSSDLFG